LGAYAAGSNPALDASIRLRPELVDFLRQDQAAASTLQQTLSKLEELASRLRSGQPTLAVTGSRQA